MKEIKDNTRRWRDILFSWIGRINFVKMIVLLKVMYRLSAISIKLPTTFPPELGQKNLQFLWKDKRSWIAKEKQSWRNQAPWLQTKLQSYSHQDSMVLAQNRNIDQRNKLESLDINPSAYDHLICDKGGKNTQWRKCSLFNKLCWGNWRATHKRMKLEHSLKPYMKINWKWIKDLNVRLDSRKFLEENIGRTLFDINHSKIFFDPTPRVMKIKTKINGT